MLGKMARLRRKSAKIRTGSAVHMGKSRKRGKTRGGMILRFPGGRESDSFWECRGPGILTVCRTPS